MTGNPTPEQIERRVVAHVMRRVALDKRRRPETRDGLLKYAAMVEHSRIRKPLLCRLTFHDWSITTWPIGTRYCFRCGDKGYGG